MHELLIARNGESETERETGKKQDRQIVREKGGEEERERETELAISNASLLHAGI